MTMKKNGDTAAITFYNLLVVAIAQVFDVAETDSPKPGDGGLKLREAVSNLIGDEGIVPEGGGTDDEGEDRRHRSHHVLQPAGG